MTTFFENLNHGDKDEILITQDILDEFWSQITNSDQGMASVSAKHIFFDEFKKAATTEPETSDLYFKTKGWKIIVKKNLIKGAILAPAIYGILTYIGVTTGLAATVLPTILPILFDIENIELSKKEEEILMKMPIQASKRNYKAANEWYSNLPKNIKEQVNELDFRDFIEKLVLGGMAKEGKNNKYQIFQKGKNKFKITFE